MSQVITFVPPTIVNLCSGAQKFREDFQTGLIDLIESDPVAKQMLEKRLRFSFKDPAHRKQLLDISYEDLRNELSLGFLSYHYNKDLISNEGVKDLRELNSVFREFSQVFKYEQGFLYLLLFYLKSKDLELRKCGVNSYFGNYNLKKILDVLIQNKAKAARPDWLIVLLQALESIFETQLSHKLKGVEKGFKEILKTLDREQMKRVVLVHLDYAVAINDNKYFSGKGI